MSASVGEGARKLGEKLLAEIEVEDLSSVLKSLRELGVSRNEYDENQSTPQHAFFGIPELVTLFSSPTPLILEFVSPPPAHHPSGAGKTSLLYLIIAHAILPTSFSSSVSFDGQSAAVILFDPLHHFSTLRLAEVMLNLLGSKLREAGRDLDEVTKSEIKTLVARSLVHVHIFRPQSWSSLLATLRSLPDYLFDQNRHKSMHRRIHLLILEDIDAFVWPIRNTLNSTNTSLLTPASTYLTSALQRLTTLLSCATILTSTSATPTTFRPAIPAFWPSSISVTRLAVRRAEVLKFAPAISVEEAEMERQQRWKVVQRGRFEAWRAGMGVRDGEGLVFRVGSKGTEIEEADTK